MNIDNTSAAPAATSSMAGPYLNVTRVAERYGVSTDTIWRWSRNGAMPKPFKLSSGSTRWLLSDLVHHEAQFSVGFIVVMPFSFAAE